MNKEFTRMLKLAGLMTEGLYTSDEKASMEAMSHDGESKVTKRKLKEKIKEMMLSEETPEEHAYKEVGSLDEDHTMDAYRIAREMVRRMDFPDAMFGSKDLFLATIKALQDELYSYAEDQFGNAGSAPDEYDDYDDSMDVYDDEYPDMAETMFEAKKDEEDEPAEEEVDAEEEIDAEEEEEVDVDVDVTDEETTDEEGDGMNVPEMEGDEGEILNHLMKALGMAKSAGDEKLIKQIGNTVTFLTRQYISGE